MKFTTIATLAAILLTGAATQSFAQSNSDSQDTQLADNRGDGNGRHHGGDRDGGRGHHGGMRMIDLNGDGIISEDEAANLVDAAFQHMDADGDGTLTEAEFTAGPRGHHGGWFNWSTAESAAVTKVRKDKFTAMDTDKNASISKAEFFADAKTRLAAADTDKDGKVTVWEFRSQN
jgi:EF hand